MLPELSGKREKYIEIASDYGISDGFTDMIHRHIELILDRSRFLGYNKKTVGLEGGVSR